MTISGTNRRAGPYSGTGSATAFPFTFKVFADSDVTVVHTDPNEVETTLALTADYTVTLNADQDASPGGSITLPAPLASGYMLTITSDVPLTQGVELTNNGGFYPSIINNALDRLTIFAQELAENLSRAISVPISSSINPSLLIASVVADAAAASVSASAAAASAAAAAAAIPSGSLGYTPVDITGDTMTGQLEVPSLAVNGSSPISTIGNAATKSTGTAAGNVPLWEYIPLNGVLSKSTAYLVDVADSGKLIDCTSSMTLTLPIAAAAGNGFALGLRNSAGSGALTIGRNGANIDGVAADITMADRESCLIVCDGIGWKTVGTAIPPAGLTFAVEYSNSTPGAWSTTAPSGARSADVTVVGANGGQGTNFGGGGGGSGGGGTSNEVIAVTPGGTLSGTVGAGGAGGTTATVYAGSGSATTCTQTGQTANGGAGGQSGYYGGAGGAGGTASGGTTNTTGTAGGVGVSETNPGIAGIAGRVIVKWRT